MEVYIQGRTGALAILMDVPFGSNLTALYELYYMNCWGIWKDH